MTENSVSAEQSEVLRELTAIRTQVNDIGRWITDLRMAINYLAEHIPHDDNYEEGSDSD